MAKRFGDVLEWYLKSMGKFGLSPSDQKIKHYIARRLKRELGNKLLSVGQVRKGERLDRMAVREYRLRMEQEGYAHGTIIRHLSLGSTAIEHALIYRDWELPNPFSKAGKGLKPNTKTRELTAGEEARILLGMRQPYRDMAELILEDGFRPGEVCYLEWDRIDGAWVLFRADFTCNGGQKSRKAGKAALSGRGLEIVRRQPKVCRWVFSRNGERIPYASFYKEWQRACKAAGVPPCSPHDGRRTFGYRVRRGGGSLDEIQAQLRHQSRATTESVYARVSEEKAMSAVTRVKSALSDCVEKP